jgi:hypothetical protein
MRNFSGDEVRVSMSPVDANTNVPFYVHFAGGANRTNDNFTAISLMKTSIAQGRQVQGMQCNAPIAHSPGKESHMENFNRRKTLALGAAIFAPVVVGLPRSAAAAMYTADAGKEILPGIQQIEIGKWPISFAKYKTVVVTDYVFAPGSGFPNEVMKNDMICQILEGEIWIKQGEQWGHSYTAKAGHVFACAKDSFKEDQNRSTMAAVMRVMDLLPA